MRSLNYLLRRLIRANIVDALKTPRKLIVGIALLIVVATTLVGGGNRPGGGELRDIRELYGMVYLLYFAMFSLYAAQGFSHGGTFFRMADVNLVFTAPFRPANVLVYGLIKRLGNALLISVLLIFQYGWVSQQYGIGIGQMLAIIGGFCIVVFCGQLTAMSVYAFVSPSERRKKGMLAVFIAFLAYSLIVAATRALAGGFVPQTMISGAVDAVTSPLIECVPVCGWVTAAVMGVFEGSALPIILGVAGSAAFCTVVLMLMGRRQDYYEDVLAATEVTERNLAQKRKGGLAEPVVGKVSTKKQGIGRGRGASVFYYRQKLEGRRASSLFFELPSLIYIAVTVVIAYITAADAGWLIAFAVSVYVLMFSMAQGRWAKELTHPYVYLAPAPPFKKLAYMCAETLFKAAAESAVIFALIGIVYAIAGMQVSVPELIAAAVTRSTFAALFISGSILMERWFGQAQSKGLALSIYFLFMMAACAPGIAGFIFAYISIETWGLFIGCAIAAVWNLAAAAGITAACRNVLRMA